MSTTVNPMYNDTSDTSSVSSSASTIVLNGENQPLGKIFELNQLKHLLDYNRESAGGKNYIIPQGFIGIHGKYNPLSSFKNLTKDKKKIDSVKIKKDQFSSIKFTEYQGINIFENTKIVAQDDLESVYSDYGTPGTNKSNLINYLSNVYEENEYETKVHANALKQGGNCYHVDDSKPDRTVFDIDDKSLSSKDAVDAKNGYLLVKDILNVTGLRKCESLDPNQCEKYKNANKSIIERVMDTGQSEIFILLTYYKGSGDEINGNGYVVNVVKKNARVIPGRRDNADVFFAIEKFSIRQNQIRVGIEASKSNLISILSTLADTALHYYKAGLFGESTKEGMIAESGPAAGSMGPVELYDEEKDDYGNQSVYGSNASQVSTQDSLERNSIMSGVTNDSGVYGPVRASSYRPVRPVMISDDYDSDDETVSPEDLAEQSRFNTRTRYEPTPPVSQASSSGVGSTSGESVSTPSSRRSSVSSDPPVANPFTSQARPPRMQLDIQNEIINRANTNTPPDNTGAPSDVRSGPSFLNSLQQQKKKLNTTQAETPINTTQAKTPSKPKNQGLFGDMSNNRMFKAAQAKDKETDPKDQIKALRSAVAGDSDDDEEGSISDDDTFAGGRGPRGGKRKSRRRSSKKRRKSKKVKGKKAKPKTKGKKIPFKKLLKKTRSKKH